MTIAAPEVMRSWSCVLFDLDGTLVDSAPGITRSLARTFEEMGLGTHSPDDLMKYVGPPLYDTLRVHGGLDDATAERALEIYREISVESDVVDNAVFPGIVGLLADLNAIGVPLALATSKPLSRAARVLEHFDLAKYFTFVGAASEDETRSLKADVVAYTLEQLAANGVDVSGPIMVGDRSYDVRGALENEVPTIMVEWGYGSPAEAVGAMAVVHSTDQLRGLLLGQSVWAA